MADISVQKIVKAFEEDNNILDGLSFEVLEGEHVGLLGRNGAGKTTLFRLIEGEIEADEGDIVIPAHKRVGIVNQIPRYPESFTAEDVLKTAHRRVDALREEMERLEKQMQTDNSPAVLRAYDEAAAEFQRLDGYELERLRNTVANGLQIPMSMREQPFSSLSGGEKTRVNLARLILEDTDILLLDEPTNHLDMRATEWLEDYLNKFKGTVLVISHDRYFLDQVVTRIVEIVDGKARFYSGNYSFYVEEKQRRYEEQLKLYEREQSEIRRLQVSADRLHQWGTGNERLMKKSQAIESRIERLRKTDRPTQERRIRARFSEREFRGDEVLVMKGVTKSFGDRTLFRELELNVAGGERIALIGDNGTGKTTLLKLIMGEEPPDAGMIRLGPAVKTAYLPQVIRFANPYRNVLDTLIYDENYTPQAARDRLGAFKFSGEDVYRPVSQLSGGEQSRLRLCILMRDDVNLLILDEPTNHLDITSREWVEETVADYEEALLFVSHDRYFINKFATRIWELENGTIRDFRGTYEQYREKRARELQTEQLKKAQETASAPERAKPPQKKGVPSRERQLAKLEREIAAAEARLREIESETAANASDYEKLLELDDARAAAEEELEALYGAWEELAET